MEKKLYSIDIETVSQGKRAVDYTNSKHYAPPKNIKDPEKIDANIRGQKEKAARTHGLSWTTGKVLSVALVNVFNQEEQYVAASHKEYEVLGKLDELLDTPAPIYLIGKTSATFDFPFLVGRYLFHDEGVPRVLRRRWNLLDVDNFFGWSASSGQRGKLDDYAHGLGIHNKPMHGSQVQDLYNTIVEAEMEGDS
ncbi:hypothetical protein, partial [Zhongshania sp.]|uniref:hypothetical protein n=1 Tax=Zhongshania sp. TaxID=1971902 RepID=UPI003567DFD2